MPAAARKLLQSIFLAVILTTYLEIASGILIINCNMTTLKYYKASTNVCKQNEQPIQILTFGFHFQQLIAKL